MKNIPVPPDHAAPSVCEHVGRYAGSTVYVVGTGTSLAEFDYNRLVGRITIGLNNAVFAFAPTYHLYSDNSIRIRYWKHAYDPSTTIVVQDQVAREARERKWPYYDQVRTFCRVNDNLADIPRNNDQLWVQRTVATAGIMLAWKLAAARIFLLGVDGYHSAAKTADGKYINYADGTAHTDQQPRDTDKQIGNIIVRENHLEWAVDMQRLKDYFASRRWGGASVPAIICANPRATFSAWPKCTLDEALQ